ncbi:hypothetical protein [Sporosarcina sp. FSL W7-1283]|uniref:hypothetical protein n=1 Tax=Sporosarcina sp. FSL W7-1283 TaxID=2921560 RepID=UPI0030FA4E4A
MKIQFNVNEKYHLINKSSYNHNYYLLPYSIEQCSVLLEECEDDIDTVEYSIGNFNKVGKFKAEHSWYGDMDGNVDLIKNELL